MKITEQAGPHLGLLNSRQDLQNKWFQKYGDLSKAQPAPLAPVEVDLGHVGGDSLRLHPCLW